MASKKKSARFDRRFVPTAATNPTLVRALFVVGSMVLGGGSFAWFGRRYQELEPHPWAFWMMAGGFAVLAIAVWLGTSSEAAVRVGPAGIAEDRGELRRIPWWALEKLSYLEEKHAIVVAGRDLSGAHLTLVLPIRAHKAAAAHALAEARARRPKVVDVSAEVEADLGPADPHAGMKIADPLQLVGRRCRASERTVTLDKDALVCGRCDAVYLVTEAPKACDCGEKLA